MITISRASVLAVAVIATACSVTSAASIGLNFSNDNEWPNFTLSDPEEAALPPNYFATDGYTNSGDLSFGGGAFGMGTLGSSGITVTFTSSNTWFAGAETSPAQQLFRSYLDDGDTGGTSTPAFQPIQAAGDGIGVSGRITGLSNYLVANNHVGYIIRAYFTTDTSGGTFQDVVILNGSQVTDTDGSDLLTATVLGVIPGTVLGGGNFPDAAGGEGVRGFADSPFLTADNIVFYIPDRSGTLRGTLAGFRITTIAPEPSTIVVWSSLGFALAALAIYRRRVAR
jgi:hypothetical protein